MIEKIVDARLTKQKYNEKVDGCKFGMFHFGSFLYILKYSTLKTTTL